MRNLFADLPSESLPDELFETLCSGKKFELKRIISTGQTTAENEWYEQDSHEWFVVLKGEAKILFADNSVRHLFPGDCLQIPAKTKHRVIYTSTTKVTVWLVIYYFD